MYKYSNASNDVAMVGFNQTCSKSLFYLTRKGLNYPVMGMFSQTKAGQDFEEGTWIAP